MDAGLFGRNTFIRLSVIIVVACLKSIVYCKFKVITDGYSYIIL